MIEAVLLDVGGVFFLPAPERIAPVLARAGVALDDPETFDRAHYHGVAALEDFREGDQDVWAAYNRAYAAACGVPADAVTDTVVALMSEFTVGGLWTREVPGARDALRALADTDVRLAIVSNSDGTVEELLREHEMCQVGPGPGVEVHAVLDSSVIGFAKPDPRIFHVALERVGIEARDAIHVGDTPGADVDGARAAGIEAVLVDPAGLHGDLDVRRVHHLRDVAGLVAETRAEI